MSEAAGLASDALVLLTEYGRDATYRRTTRSGGDSAWTPNASTSDTAVKVQEWALRDRTRAGDRTQTRQTRFILSASGLAFTPKADDLLIVGTDTWRITMVERYPIEGTDTIYVLHGEWHGTA